MSQVKTRPKAADVSDVTKWSTALTDWERKRDDAQARLTATKTVIGAEVLDDPAAVTKKAQAARDDIEAADAAIRAVSVELEAARTEALEAAAATFDREADRLQRELDAHRAVTDDLLSKLEDHECRFVPERDWARLRLEAGRSVPVDGWSSPRSEGLALLVERESLKAAVIRDVVAGVDPAVRLRDLAGIESTVYGLPLDDYYAPCVWGPAAVLPAPAFASKVEAVRARLAEHDAAVAVDDGPEIAKRQQVIDEINAQEEAARDRRRTPLTLQEQQRRSGRQKWIVDREVWRREAPSRRAALIDELEALTGTRGEQMS